MEIFIEKLNEKTCKELRTILKNYNIPSSGTKNVLIGKNVPPLTCKVTYTKFIFFFNWLVYRFSCWV